MLKSDQNCSVQVNLFIAENFVKTLNAFISKLHFENGNQDSRVLFKFTGLM